jgi:hypothetical protein
MRHPPWRSCKHNRSDGAGATLVEEVARYGVELAAGRAHIVVDEHTTISNLGLVPYEEGSP